MAALALAVLLIALLPARATTIRVPDDEATIQGGIDASSAGDTVVVACGSYYEHDITMKSGVCLISETGLADCVTVDAQQLSRVFYCSDLDSLASIVGFTVTGGSSDHGGGVMCYSSSLVLEDCAFVGNEAEEFGGGIECISSSLVLTDCTFVGNQAEWGGGIDLTCYGDSVVLVDCEFAGNQADYGGAACFIECSPALTRCTFEANRALSGGGIYCGNLSDATFMSCSLVANHADSGGSGLHCAGVSLPALSDCIVAFGTGAEAVGCNSFLVPVLACCDVYGNAGGDWVGDIADQYGANGNFSSDPLFCNAGTGDFTLCEDSPCVPGNHPSGSGTCELIGAWDVGCPPCAAVAVENLSWGVIKAMFR